MQGVNEIPFLPNRELWVRTVRERYNLAAQLEQALAELDAAREHAERQQLSKDGLYRELREMAAERDAARVEVARLKEEVEGAYEAHNEAVTIFERRLEMHKEAMGAVIKALPAVAINEMEEIWGASNTALVRKALAFLWHCAALSGNTAPVTGRE